MKLFIDCHVFDDGFQGTRTYIEGLYRQMIVQASHIDFYMAANDIDNLKKVFGNHSNVHYLKYRYKNKFLRLIWDIPELIRKNNIDFAHFQYVVPLFKRCKEIVTIHDLLFLDFPKYFPLSYKIKNKILFRLSAKRADILLTVSNYSHQAISRLFDIPFSNIYITPNAVKVPDESKSLFNQEYEVLVKYNLKDFLLYVGRLEPRKNHILLLKAFVELELWKRGVKLVFIGKRDLICNEYDEYYQCLSKEVKEKVLHLVVENFELEILYKHCKLFVFPSLAEGFGIPPLEAVIHGANTLCSNATAMKEFTFFQDKFFDPYNLDELKTKISFFLDHADQEQLTEEARIVRNKYNWEIIAHNFLNQLSKITNQ